MMKVSIFLLGIGLLLAGVKAQTERPTLSDADFESFLSNQTGLALAHLRLNDCSGVCTQSMEQVKNRAAKVAENAKNITVFTAPIPPSVADAIGQTSSFGLYCIFNGQMFRLDEEGNQSLNEVNTLLDRFFNGAPQDYSEGKTEGIQFINVYFGGPKNKRFGELEVVARLSASPVYYTNKEEVADELSLDTKGGFFTKDAIKNSTVKLTSKATVNNMLRFMQLSNNEIPQKLNIDKLRNATQSGTPVIIIKPSSEVSSQNIVKILGFDLEELIKNHFQVFSLLDNDSEEAGVIADYCTDTAHPSVNILCVMVDLEGELQRYIYNRSKFSMELIQDFLNEFLDGRLDPYYRHETITQRYNKAGVKNLNTYEVAEFLAANADDNSHRVVVYYSSSENNLPLLQFADSLSLEYSDGLVKVAKVDLDKNEALEPGIVVNSLYMNGGETGRPLRVYSGPSWDNRVVKAWVEAQLVKTPNEKLVSEDLVEVSIASGGKGQGADISDL